MMPLIKSVCIAALNQTILFVLYTYTYTFINAHTQQQISLDNVALKLTSKFVCFLHFFSGESMSRAFKRNDSIVRHKAQAKPPLIASAAF